MNSPESVFNTKVGRRSLAVTIAGCIAILSPFIADTCKRHTRLHPADIDNAQNAISQLIGFIAFGGGYGALTALADPRFRIYSPPYMSGANKKDLEESMQAASDEPA